MAKDYEWVKAKGMEFSAILAAGIHSMQKKEVDSDAEAIVADYRRRMAEQVQPTEREVATDGASASPGPTA